MLRCDRKVRLSCRGKCSILEAELFGVANILQHVLVVCEMSQYSSHICSVGVGTVDASVGTCFVARFAVDARLYDGYVASNFALL